MIFSKAFVLTGFYRSKENSALFYNVLATCELTTFIRDQSIRKMLVSLKHTAFHMQIVRLMSRKYLAGLCKLMQPTHSRKTIRQTNPSFSVVYIDIPGAKTLRGYERDPMGYWGHGDRLIPMSHVIAVKSYPSIIQRYMGGLPQPDMEW